MLRWILLICLYPQFASALTIYQFKYYQRIGEQQVATEALFLQHDNGRGFMKTRYFDPITKSKMLLDMELEEEFISDGKGYTSQQAMYVHTKNPHIITGSNRAAIQLPVIYFTINKNTAELEPAALVKILDNGTKQIDSKAALSATFIDAKSLPKLIGPAFFADGDLFLEKQLKGGIRQLTPDELKTVIHLFIVADTLEEQIGTSCAFDAKRVLNTYTEVIRHMGTKMNVTMIAGTQYNKKNVVSSLKLLKPGKNDIVVFYYTGHGYRKNDDNRRYPYIDLRCKQHSDYLTETLNMEDIYRFIKRKGARMNLVLSDCCNSYVGKYNAVASAPPKKKTTPLQFDNDNISMLFLKAKISILATAADSTQRASGNPSFGGFFSYFLNTTLEASCSNTKTAYAKANSSPVWWNEVLTDTRTQTEKKAQFTYCDKPYIKENICIQSPCFMIE